MTQRETSSERDVHRRLGQIGDHESVRRFVSKYGNIRTKLEHVIALYHG